MAEESKQTPVAAILGVGPGLGAALARRFAKGYAVAVVARRADYLKSVGDGIRASGGGSLEVTADVGNRGQVAAAFKVDSRAPRLTGCADIQRERRPFRQPQRDIGRRI